MVNFYTILGIEPTASKDEIKKAYRKLAKQFHPDKNSNSKESEERFKIINEANEILSNDAKRKNHDFLLHEEELRQQNFSKQWNPSSKTAYSNNVNFNWRHVFAFLLIFISIVAFSGILLYNKKSN